MSRFSYWFAGFQIDTNVRFGDLAPIGEETNGSATQSLCTIDFETVDELPEFHSTFDLVHWDELIHSQRTDDDGTTIRFDNTAEYAISPDRGTLICRHTPDADGAALRHTLLDQVLPRLLSARGHFVLHASGITTPQGAVLFLGDSGAGKSTLAASFRSRGCELLGDDCFLAASEAGQFVTWPTYRGLRLLPASVDHLYGPDRTVITRPMAAASPKVRVIDEATPTATADRREQIAAIFIIDRQVAASSGPPAAGQLDPRQALIELIRNSFRLDINGRDAVAASLDHATALAQSVPMFWVSYERNFESLHAVHDMVLSLVDSLPAIADL